MSVQKQNRGGRISRAFAVFGAAVAASAAVEGGRRPAARDLRTLGIDGSPEHEIALGQLSPLGWDHINLTGDYVWLDPAAFDADGFLPLKVGQR